MVRVNMFAYVHNMPQVQTGRKIFFSVEYILTHMAIFTKCKDSTQKNSAVEKERGRGGGGGCCNNLLPKARVKRRISYVRN